MGARQTLLFSLAFSLTAAVAAAEPASGVTARADELFEAGKARLAAGEVQVACELLGESYRLAPGTGVLLALAICHEREGKLASAFREYSLLVDGASAQTRPDRLQTARERSAALAQKLSRLTVVLEPQPQGVEPEVRLDDQLLPAEELGRAIPVDGGSHRLTATAEGMRPFAADLTIAASDSSETVRVPRLEPKVDLTSLARIPIVRPMSSKASPVPVSQSIAVHTNPQLTLRDWVGVGALGGGVATLGVGGLMTLRAVHDNNVANSGCGKSGCVDEPADRPLRLNATTKATLLVGAVLTVAGTSLLLLRVASRRGERAPLTAWVVPWSSSEGAGAELRGHF